MVASARAKRRFLAASLVVLGAIAIAAVVWRVQDRPRYCDLPQPPGHEARVEREHESALTEPRVETRAPRAVPVVAIATESAPAPVASIPSGPPIRLWGAVRAPRIVLPSESIYVTCTDGLGTTRRVTVDERSQYAFDDLQPGRHWLSAGAESLGTASAVVEVRGVDRVDLVLEAERELLVRIVDEAGVDWRPPGVEFVVTRSDPGEWTQHVPTSSQRVFAVGTAGAKEFTRPEVLTLRWPPPLQVGLVRYQLVVASQPVGEHETELVFRVARDDARLADGSVRFRFVDAATRETVALPSIDLTGADQRMIGSTAPAGDGGHGPHRLRPGWWTLRALGSAGTVRRSFRIEPGVDLDLGDIPVGGGATIRGRLLDAEGNGLRSGFQCEPCDEHGVVGPRTAVEHGFMASADGTFELRGLARGLYRLAMRSDFDVQARRAWREPVAIVRVVDLRRDDASGIVLRAQNAVALCVRPSGRETMESGFRVLDADGVVVSQSSVPRGQPVRVGLVAGVYDVERWHERDGPRERVTIRIVDEAVGVDMP